MPRPAVDRSSHNTYHVVGDRVTVRSPVQGLQPGTTYRIVDHLEQRTPFGTFVTYLVQEREGLPVLPVTNGHLVLVPRSVRDLVVQGYMPPGAGRQDVVHRTAGWEPAGSLVRVVDAAWGALWELPDGTQGGAWYRTEAEARERHAKSMARQAERHAAGCCGCTACWEQAEARRAAQG